MAQRETVPPAHGGCQSCGMTVSPAASASLIVAASDLRVVQLVRGAINPPPGIRGGPTPRFRAEINPEPRFAPRPVVHPEPQFEARPILHPKPVAEPAARPPEAPAEPLLPPRFGPLPPPWLMPCGDAAAGRAVPAGDGVKPAARLVEVNPAGQLLDQFV